MRKFKATPSIQPPSRIKSQKQRTPCANKYLLLDAVEASHAAGTAPGRLLLFVASHNPSIIIAASGRTTPRIIVFLGPPVVALK